MGDLDRIITITITRATATPTIQSFSDVLIVDEFLVADITPAFNDRTRAYSSVAAMTTAGFGAASAAVLAATAVFSQSPSITQVKIGRKLTGIDGSETWTQALDNIILEDADWYGLVVGTRTKADQQLAATWAELNKKLLGVSSDDSNIIDGSGDIVEYLNTQNFKYSHGIYNPESDLSADDEWPEAAWVGKLFTKNPGSATWAYKTLAGVTPNGADAAHPALTTAQLNTLFGKEGNTVNKVAGISITEKGTVGSGEFIDVRRGTDWLAARIQQLTFTLLVNSDKVPYTDAGIQAVGDQVSAALQEGVDNNFLNPDFTVTVPLSVDVSSGDKGNRVLNDVTFSATLTGAIHTITIAGTVVL